MNYLTNAFESKANPFDKMSTPELMRGIKQTDDPILAIGCFREANRRQVTLGVEEPVNPLRLMSTMTVRKIFLDKSNVIHSASALQELHHRGFREGNIPASNPVYCHKPEHQMTLGGW